MFWEGILKQEVTEKCFGFLILFDALYFEILLVRPFSFFCSQLTVRSMDSESPLDGDSVLKSEGDRNFVKNVHGSGKEVARKG